MKKLIFISGLLFSYNICSTDSEKGEIEYCIQQAVI